MRGFRELDVYWMAMDAAVHIFALSKGFWAQEKYSLTDQVRRSLRSVCANIAEAWRKHRSPNAFVCPRTGIRTHPGQAGPHDLPVRAMDHPRRARGVGGV